MPSWLIEVCWAIVGIGVLGVGVFAFDKSRKEQLRVRRYAAKLRDCLQPMALAVGAEVSARIDERGVVIYYTFADGSFVSLSVGDSGFNYFSPVRSLSHEKNNEGLSRLMAAIQDEYEKPINAGNG